MTTTLFIFGTKINENYPNFVPKINKGVVFFLETVQWCITALHRATEFVQGVNHYLFIYINDLHVLPIKQC